MLDTSQSKRLMLICYIDEHREARLDTYSCVDIYKNAIKGSATYLWYLKRLRCSAHCVSMRYLVTHLHQLEGLWGWFKGWEHCHRNWLPKKTAMWIFPKNSLTKEKKASLSSKLVYLCLIPLSLLSQQFLDMLFPYRMSYHCVDPHPLLAGIKSSLWGILII